MKVPKRYLALNEHSTSCRKVMAKSNQIRKEERRENKIVSVMFLLVPYSFFLLF